MIKLFKIRDYDFIVVLSVHPLNCRVIVKKVEWYK